jgi:hypothetical protein
MDFVPAAMVIVKTTTRLAGIMDNPVATAYITTS